ncbi:glycosyltransferase, group 2 family protein [Segatella oris F0302]|uniref:Glycosyltransferase, group 2 family protein n=1 Tax=Segatella oris F0302 TaxID=649760 RepID=D1QRQ5_9BACT|nr:glycosyltransferase family 2 protein [Segatella oris]EFB31912.1 glycosyltransferase, group 2 family protein [Segatella oris F0302]MBF1448138.1 glycosyltransferase family 2 protein [Segatella oris]
MNGKERITVIINTYNAERHLKVVLESVKGFDEVLVCDMESKDHTIEIARSYGWRVITFPKGTHHIVEPARQFAIDRASNPWVLIVDADEVVSEALRNYLYEAIGEKDCPDAIAIPRKNYFMGKMMHSCYPDYVLRFLKRENCHWPPVIHASPKVNGRVLKIPSARHDLAFEHLANDTVADIIAKNNTYSDYEVPRRRSKNYATVALFYRPAFRFFKSYFLKRGFMDGLPGLIHAMLEADYQFTIVAKLIEERRAK